MFYLVGIIVTFFLAAILTGKRNKTDADCILVAWLGTIGIHLVSYYLLITGKNLSLPFILGLEMPLPLLHGPFLYLYAASVTSSNAKKSWRILHLLPFMLSYAWIAPFLFSPAEHKIFVYENKGLGHESTKWILNLFIKLSGIIYVALSLRILVMHKRLLRDHFSYTEKINLAWLRYLIYGMGSIWLIVILVGTDAIIYGAVVVFVILLGYFGIKQVGTFTQQVNTNILNPKPQEKITPGQSGKGKYQKSSLSQEDAESIHQQLSLTMGEQKLFTNPELTLADLAKHLNVHPNNLSQVINTHEQKSFYDYVNYMRVEEFKRVVSLPENQKFNLLGLAQNCGFNSKTSFNRNFKNTTGLSPTEFLSQAHILLGR